MTPFPALLATLLLAVAVHANASETMLRADIPASGDTFATSVAIDGDLAVVGMPGDDTIAGDAGAAYIYQRTPGGWMLLQTLYGAALADQFGYAVAVVDGNAQAGNDDVIAVGSLNGEGVLRRTGNVRIYRRTAPALDFSSDGVLYAADSLNWDSFGASLALDLSIPSEGLSNVPVFTLAVGAPGVDKVGSGYDAGAVYMYQGNRSGLGAWAVINKIQPDDLVGGDELGGSVAVSGDFILAGATGWPYGNHPEGVAYLIRRFYDTGAGYYNWELNNRLTASDGASGDRFGARVAFDQVPVVSAPNADNGGNGGAVYVFCCKGVIGYDVTESSKIAAPNATNRQNFGTTLATDGQLIMVGDGSFPGHLDVFRADTSGIWSWNLAETTAIADPAANRADTLALSLPYAIAGDPLHTGGGAAYILSDNTLNDPIFRNGFE